MKGSSFTCWTFLYGGAAAGLYSFILLLLKRRLTGTLKRVCSFFLNLARIVRYPGYKVIPMDKEESVLIPFGVALCIGSVVTWYLKQ